MKSKNQIRTVEENSKTTRESHGFQVTAPDRIVLPRSRNGQTALVVDEEPISRNVCCNALRKIGYGVVEAATAEEAVALCQKTETEIDLLIAGFRLSGSDGRRLAARIRERWPNVRVLITSTTRARVSSTAGSEEQSGSAFLEKPFRIAEFYQTVESLFSEADSSNVA